MITRTFYACLLLSLCAATANCSSVAPATEPKYERPLPQAGSRSSSDGAFDPLEQVTNTFPQSIKLNQSSRVLEFCPDFDTCDGFVASPTVSIATLKDLGYLYIYFFSNYFDLPRWRTRPESQATAQRVLSEPEYRSCKRESDFDTARCVLLGFSQKGRIRLEFVRYDEGKRNVVPEDLVKELSEKKSPPRQ
jgi:hypothetical protein